MELDPLDVLEEKVNTAIKLINKLQLENNNLKQENRELQEIIKERDLTIQKLDKEIKKLKGQQQGTGHNFHEKEEILKNKIEGLLAKLDSFSSL